MVSKSRVLANFFVDHNLGLSDTELSKTTGLTVRQIRNRRLKIQGRNREGGLKGEPENPLKQAMPSRENELIKQASEVSAPPSGVPEQSGTFIGKQINKLIGRKEGAGVAIMTGAASELSDMVDGNSPYSKKNQVQEEITHDPFADASRVHKIK